MRVILLIAQIFISLAIIVVILMQSKGTGIGTVFGGSESFYRSKKGVEKLFVYLTIILAILFAVVSIVQVII